MCGTRAPFARVDWRSPSGGVRAQKITDKCFTRCVIKPNTRLDDAEKMCTAKCMDRYLDAMALVSQAWAARAKQQAAQGSMGGGFE